MSYDFFGNLASGSASGLAQDFGGVGLGLQAAGAVGSLVAGMQMSKTEGQISNLNSEIGSQQMAQDQLRQQQMVLNTQRSQMQNLRNLQRARMSGLSNATASGSQFGSGLQGAYGAQSGQAGTNSLNTSQNFQIGQQNFQLTEQQDWEKMQISSLQGTLASQQGMMSAAGGLSSMGSGMFGGAMSFGKLFGNS